MSVRVLKLCLIAGGALLFIHAGGSIQAGDAAKTVEVFVDLDGDGFDDNESDVNKDGVPDLVCPVEAPKFLVSTADIFSSESQTSVPVVKVSNAQRFSLRSFSVRALLANRASVSTGFEDLGSAAALGAEACPGGNCGL